MNSEFENLCNDMEGRLEDRSFDLKRAPPTVNDVVKEIQGGMNGLERRYRVIVGIDEGVEKKFSRKNIMPITWPAGRGALVDADIYRTAIDASLKASTTDFHEGYWLFKSIPVPGGEILIIEILQSPYGPHQNTQDGRYYIRREGSTSHMTAAEIRQALQPDDENFEDPEAPRDALLEGELIADLRHHDWIQDINELRFHGGPQLHVRVSPLELQQGRFSGTHLKNSVQGLHALGPWRDGSHERVSDGFLAWRVEAADVEKTSTFSKVFETAEIWGVDGATLSTSSNGTADISAAVVHRVHKALLQYGDVLEGCLQIASPYRVQVVLHDVKDARFYVSSNRGDGQCLNDTIVYNAIWNRTVDPTANDLSNDFARVLWDACGLSLANRIQFQV